jgi:hypothetical protein
VGRSQIRATSDDQKRLALATSNDYKNVMSDDDERRQRDQAPPSPNKENFEFDVPPSGTINISPNAPPASSAVGWKIEMPSSVAAASTATTTAVIMGPRPRSPIFDPAPPVDDPIVTVVYESWMFFETARFALDHWDELPNVVIRHAVAEDAVLHARSLCEVILSPPKKKDIITLAKLFPDLETNAVKYVALIAHAKELKRAYEPKYRMLFNSRVVHPTVLRGNYGLYEEPLRHLQPKILAVVCEIARLKDLSFQLSSGEVIGSSTRDTK